MQPRFSALAPRSGSPRPRCSNGRDWHRHLVVEKDFAALVKVLVRSLSSSFHLCHPHFIFVILISSLLSSFHLCHTHFISFVKVLVPRKKQLQWLLRRRKNKVFPCLFICVCFRQRPDFYILKNDVYKGLLDTNDRLVVRCWIVLPRVMRNELILISWEIGNLNCDGFDHVMVIFETIEILIQFRLQM